MFKADLTLHFVIFKARFNACYSILSTFLVIYKEFYSNLVAMELFLHPVSLAFYEDGRIGFG